VNTSELRKKKSLQLNTSRKVSGKASLTVLRHDRPEAFNTIEKPEEVFPSERELTIKGKSFEMDLEPYSFNVVKLKLLK